MWVWYKVPVARAIPSASLKIHASTLKSLHVGERAGRPLLCLYIYGWAYACNMRTIPSFFKKVEVDRQKQTSLQLYAKPGSEAGSGHGRLEELNTSGVLGGLMRLRSIMISIILLQFQGPPQQTPTGPWKPQTPSCIAPQPTPTPPSRHFPSAPLPHPDPSSRTQSTSPWAPSLSRAPSGMPAS